MSYRAKIQLIEEREKNAHLRALNAEMLAALRDCRRVIDLLMPGIKHIAVEDYAALNDAPIRADKVIREAEEESSNAE